MIKPSLFIAIPAYQESDALARTIEFFRSRTAGPHVVRTYVAQQSVVTNKNTLLAEARDSGAAFVAMSDDDVEPQASWDQKLIDGMQQASRLSGRRIGQTAPRMLLPDGRLFSLWANVYLSGNESEFWVKPVKYNQPDEAIFRARLFVGVVPGTLSIFSREVLEAMNWRFDDRYDRSQYDDVDQSLECRRLGFEVLYNGDVSIIHHTVQATPRAADENYQKLRAKWSGHRKLTLIVEPHPDAIDVASRQAAGRLPTVKLQTKRVLRALRRRLRPQ